MNRKILVVDDEIYNIEIVSSVLKKDKFEIIGATNPEKGLDLFYQEKPFLIILDLRMPGMDGLDFLKKINVKIGSGFSVIVFSAHGTLEDIKKAYEYGVLNFLRKPVNIYELRGLVENIYKMHQSQHLLQYDLELGQKLQKKILNKSLQEHKHFQVDIEYHPLEKVGGDFYQITNLNENKIRLFFADAAGHGVEAALTTLVIKNEYDKINSVEKPIEEIMEELNKVFIHDYNDFVIIFPAIIMDIEITGKMEYVSCGMPEGFIIHPDGSKELIRNTSVILGVSDKQKIAVKNTLQINQFDQIFLFSDGYTEPFNSDGHQYAKDRMLNFLDENKGSLLLENAIKDLKNYISDVNLQDDLTLISIKLSD